MRPISQIGSELREKETKLNDIRSTWQGRGREMPKELVTLTYSLIDEVPRLQAEFDAAVEARGGIDIEQALSQSEKFARRAEQEAENGTATRGGYNVKERFSYDTLYSGQRFQLSSKQLRVSRLRNIPGQRTDIAGIAGAWFAGWVSKSKATRAAAHRLLADNGIESYYEEANGGINPVGFRALSEGNNNLGGFLVPDAFSNVIIDLREYFGVARQYLKMQQMSTETLNVPRRAPGVQITAGWVGENNPIAESLKRWENVQLVAKKLAAATRYSTELAEDAFISIGDDLIGEIPYSFSYIEDLTAFFGDGSSDFNGIQGITKKLAGMAGEINESGTGGNGWENILIDDIENVIASTGAYPGMLESFFCNKAFYYRVMVKLALEAGGVYASEIVQGLRASNNMAKFMGFDVVFSQVFPSTSPESGQFNIPLLFGDLSKCGLFGDRRSVTIAQSTEAADTWLQDQAIIKGTERIDIAIHDVGTASIYGPVSQLKVSYS